jgi:uncharacterized protein YqjF (DUF2071 family)
MTLRERLSTAVVGYQRWDEILFVHLRARAESLRPLVDRRLELDVLGERAFVSLTPFTVRGARLRGLPRLPALTRFHELNLRTYVRAPDGEPGIWFFSLDAASAPAAALARLGLPYRVARMSRAVDGRAHDYASERTALGPRPASFSARWSVGGLLQPGEPERFLVERYALYTSVAGQLLRVRVRHPPWVLRAAWLERLEETVTRAARVALVREPPLAHYSDGVDVAFLAPERVR